MKTSCSQKTSYFAILSLAYIMALTTAACSGNDNEHISGVPLSEETTPIDFEFENFEHLDKYILFDYAGNRYVGSDTIFRSKCTLNLRQGKHHLIWMKGVYGSDVGFNPEARSFSGNNTSVVASYAEMDIEVTPYLMPAKQVDCSKQITITGGGVNVEITDMDGDFRIPSGAEASERIRVSGFPLVDKISLDGSSYETLKDVSTYLCFFDERGESVGFSLYTLRPDNNVEKLQMKVEVKDVGGNHIPTTTLPAVSLQRGYITIMRGPLFSGSTADWTVTMEPY